MALQVFRANLRNRFENLEAEIRSAMVDEIPRWMEAQEAENALRSSPAWKSFLLLKDAAPSVSLPLVLNGPSLPGSSEMKTALDRFRVAPLSEWERKIGDETDSFKPGQVSHEIRTFLAHLVRVEETSATDLLA